MEALILILTALVFPSANADTCIAMEGSSVHNRCQSCVELTARALRPPAEQASGLFTGESRSVRLEAGARIEMNPCR
jgi:hypothetical protein